MNTTDRGEVRPAAPCFALWCGILMVVEESLLAVGGAKGGLTRGFRLPAMLSGGAKVRVITA
jgi:hypothetical protein